MQNSKAIRLDKYLSEQKIATRSKLKIILKKQNVCVNGLRVTDGSVKINPSSDEISIDGKIITNVGFQYVMLNKPADFITATKDNRERTVLDLIGDDILKKDELSAVGRLDKDTTGFLLLTNDGELNHRLLSPKFHVKKKYLAGVDMPLADFEAAALSCEKGIDIGDEKPTMPAKLEKTSDKKQYYLTITEGRFHQVKRMFKALGVNVVTLKRISMGELELDENLKSGEYRLLSDEEIKLLKNRFEE